MAFAFVKATEGGDWTDPRFEANWRDARRAGLRVGAYHFFTFCRPGLEQARHFLAVVPAEPDALPPALDVEFGGNCGAPPDRATIRRELGNWLDAVERARGRRPLVYTTSDAYAAFLEGAPLANPVWIRDVWREPSKPAGWLLWQFDSRAHVRGVDAFVDLNVFSGGREAFDAL